MRYMRYIATLRFCKCKNEKKVKLLLSQASKDMHEPLVPMLFPSLGAHISGAEFQYPDRSWKEMCGIMANLVGESGCENNSVEIRKQFYWFNNVKLME